MANLLSDLDVTLIIKAPNQKIADQTIKCEMEWTVKRLKQHLSEVYPNQPKENQQRIIYSGRLLHDHLTLKEILKKDNETHTVHLVCPPEKSASTSNQSSGQEPSALPAQRDETQKTLNNAAPRPNTSSLSEEEMRRLYQEYYGYAYQWYHQQMLRNYMGGSVMDASPSAAPMAASQPAAAGISEDGRSAREQPVQAEVRPPPAVQPAAMAAGPGGIGGEFDEENFERDWLDWFYYALRVAILIGLLNYYSSLSKILTAIGVSCIFGLYRFVFQRRNRPTGEPQPRGQAEPAAAENEPAAPTQGVREQETPASAPSETAEDRSEVNSAGNVNSTSTGGTTRVEEVMPERISVIRKLWNSFYLCTQFFVTLFTSLVPERIPPLDLN